MTQSCAAPTVSVVIPVYNVEAYVAEAISSVLAQSFEDFELILVDDGGTDGSMAICRAFTDRRIRIVSQDNRGLAGARNTGIAAARGQYVAFLDADDRWHASKLFLHVIHLNANPAVDVSYSGSRMIDEQGREMKVAMRPKLTQVSPADILMRNPVGNGSTPVIRRTALDRVGFAHPTDASRTCWFDETFRQSEDIEMWMRMALRHGCRFEGIQGLLVDYRIVGGGLSARIPQQFESWSRAMSRLDQDAPEFMARYRVRAEAFQLRYLARRAVQLGDGGLAVSLSCKAMRACPRILMYEPRKTLLTMAAAVASKALPAKVVRALGKPYLGAALAA